MSEWAIRSKKTSDSFICSFWWAIRSHRSFLVSDLSDSLTSLFKKEGMREFSKNLQKTLKDVKKYDLWAKEQMSDLLQKNEQFARSLFYHERPECIAHGCYFVMSDLSNLLTVACLSWANWANRSQSLIFPERFEQMSDERMMGMGLGMGAHLLAHRWALQAPGGPFG